MVPLLFAVLCVLANGFFVAAEFALAKVRPTALETMVEAGDKLAVRALALTRKLDAYLTATQLGITLASLGLGWLGEPAIARYVEPVFARFGLGEKAVHTVSLSLAFFVITAAHIIIGELIPKSLAIQRPENVARYTARLLHWFFIFSYPVMWVLNRLSNAALRLMGLPQAEHPEGKLSVEELRLLVRASFPVQGREAQKRDIMERVLAGLDRPVRAIMVPRVDVVALPWSAGVEKCLSLAGQHGYSRYPMSENGELDTVTGYIYVKDLLVNPVKDIDDLRSREREILFMPESRSVGNALADFQASTTPIAVVVDEFGGTAGLVTQEDAIETLVGDLKDELDKEAPRLQVKADGTVTADGSLPVHQLAMAGINIGVNDESNTVGGAVQAVLGRLPRSGDRLRLGSFDAVIDVRRRRVTRVMLYPRAPTTPPIAEGEPSEG